jgi:hypothetical protein
MNTGGWIFMIVSYAVILALVVFCFARVFFGGDNTNNEVSSHG